MARSKTHEHIRRLDRLAVQLKQGDHCTVHDLAAQFGVSARTISRDLAIMREQGMPIDADRGRGGGVRLDRNWGVGRLNLSYPEAVDLLISIAVAEQMNSPIFLANLGAVRRQLVASFSPDKRRKVDRLKSRILVGETASTFVQASMGTTPKRNAHALNHAFLDQRVLDIQYQREDKTVSSRTIEPHYLLLKYPVWYCVSFDHLRNAARIFRCDRIVSAAQSETSFNLRSKQYFEPSLLNDDLVV